MHITEPLLQDTPDNGRHWNWCCRTTGGQGCPGMCHGMPHLPHPHTPDHLRSPLTPSPYTPVSLRCTLRKLAQPCHSCGQTKLGSMSNFPGLSPYVSGHCLFVFFSIYHICLM